jgi:N-formylglutamate deformylase
LIDVNRDPSGASLYPGQSTTELCPTTTFDGEALYRHNMLPDRAEIAERTMRWFQPYHEALSAELDRLRAVHDRVVLYDCHSIRSIIPRLFEGRLPHFNIGTHDGKSCASELNAVVDAACDATSLSRVSNGRFTGGWITRHYGKPQTGVHAIQMELACRGYLAEPLGPVDQATWPTLFEKAYAEPMAAALSEVLQVCILFAAGTIRGTSR